MNKPFAWLILPLLQGSVSLAGLPFTGPDLWITQKGVELFSEKFSGSQIDTNHWIAAKGLWKVENGVLTGVELADDHHAASIRTAIPFENAIIQFDLLAHIDKQTFVLGSHEQMGSPKKSFGFPVQGESASFDNVKVWAATPKADTATLSRLQGAKHQTGKSPQSGTGLSLKKESRTRRTEQSNSQASVPACQIKNPAEYVPQGFLYTIAGRLI